jgi:hypothetical protein
MGGMNIQELQVKAFGEIDNPETHKIAVSIGEDFQCPCGIVINLGGPWVAAHWDEKLKYTCECGQLFFIRSGIVRLRQTARSSGQ